MPDDFSVLRAAADLAQAGHEFIMVTVVATRGSTPRNPGARMIWTPDAAIGAQLPTGSLGTVGGGQFEHMVLESARACLAAKTHTIEHFVLGADADQCCGGTMDVFLEYHGPRARVVLFGAGHVAFEIGRLLDGHGLQLVVVDDRPDWNSAERFPNAKRLTDWSPGIAAARERPATTLAAILTYSHDTDFELLRALCAEGPLPAFLGLIGSRSKRACLFSRLVASGIDEGNIERIHCPIGVGDTGKEPIAVALSITAQILIHARTLTDARH